jgi:hypothetical protein
MLRAADDALQPVSAYTITAYQHGKQPRTLQLVAVSPAAAMLTAMELMPGWLISSPTLTPEWTDDLPPA